MNQPERKEVRIFNAAPERAAYLDHACAGHAVLRRQVEALLQACGEGGCGIVFMAEQEEPLHRPIPRLNGAGLSQRDRCHHEGPSSLLPASGPESVPGGPGWVGRVAPRAPGRAAKPTAPRGAEVTRGRKGGCDLPPHAARAERCAPPPHPLLITPSMTSLLRLLLSSSDGSR